MTVAPPHSSRTQYPSFTFSRPRSEPVNGSRSATAEALTHPANAKYRRTPRNLEREQSWPCSSPHRNSHQSGRGERNTHIQNHEVSKNRHGQKPCAVALLPQGAHHDRDGDKCGQGLCDKIQNTHNGSPQQLLLEAHRCSERGAREISVATLFCAFVCALAEKGSTVEVGLRRLEAMNACEALLSEIGKGMAFVSKLRHCTQ